MVRKTLRLLNPFFPHSNSPTKSLLQHSKVLNEAIGILSVNWLLEIDKIRTVDMGIIEEVLTITQNIAKAYKEADIFRKKAYLHFFFKEFLVKDKKIAEIKYQPVIEVLQQANTVILSTSWLTTPPLTLYQIFNRETIARVRIQLEVARKLASNPLAYQVVEVTNGRFCQLPVPS